MIDPQKTKSPDDRKTFDMYHFFSRWDMLLAGGVIIALLLAALYYYFTPVTV